ncbi:MAG TPA: serine hydrolase, partial [Bdellovibrionales bacterium]|nr:serine hydrolase [Bdellovibrionales bacterium]
MKTIKFILFVVAIVLAPAMVFAQTPESLDSVISAALKSTQPSANSGLSIAIVKDGKVIFAKGYGYRDREKHLPVTSKTLFAIGSTSKAFTSFALKMAESRGLVEFNSPVKNIFPEFALMNKRATEEANLIDLLSHRIGLPRHDALWYLSDIKREEI